MSPEGHKYGSAVPQVGHLTEAIFAAGKTGRKTAMSQFGRVPPKLPGLHPHEGACKVFSMPSHEVVPDNPPEEPFASRVPMEVFNPLRRYVPLAAWLIV